MEGTSVLASPTPFAPKTLFTSTLSLPPKKFSFVSAYPRIFRANCTTVRSSVTARNVALPNSVFKLDEEPLEKGEVDSSSMTSSSSKEKEMMPKIDKSGRFCSPRAARELALSIIYAACLDGSDPVRLFEKRVNARREPGYEFDKNSLLKYNHMSFGGPPVTTETVEEADELLHNDELESAIEAEVLSAPPKLVYSKLILRLARKILVVVMEKWDTHVLAINKVAPDNWKNEPAGRILEFCVLHMAMSEIDVLGTRHQIVINEAVDLAKRFCDGAAPRIINGCLRTFVKDLEAERNGVQQEVLTSAEQTTE